jgi:NCS1 family nucleobase:cation symporter-1
VRGALAGREEQNLLPALAGANEPSLSRMSSATISPTTEPSVMEIEDLRGSPLFNEDLAPVPCERRTWRAWDFAALWIGMAVCIPSYTLAAGLISQGMTWGQALFTILLGNVVVLVPILLNAHAGARYGIPFPVLLRASFGTVGANVPAMMRALVACGWFGIQTWIGGQAIYLLLANVCGFVPAAAAEHLPGLGVSLGQLACFLVFWAIHMAIILRGMDGVKWLEVLSAPLLIVFCVALLVWGIIAGGGLGNILAHTNAGAKGEDDDGMFWRLFWPNLTAMVGFWATLSLNIPDFTRFARSQRDQIVGQAAALPASMAALAFIGIAVSGATVVVFGEVIWDPVQLMARFDSPWVVSLALVAIIIATLSTNLAANVVSPANDISNLKPTVISFKRGALITGVIGILIMPWRLYNDLGQYIFTWLIGYGALLGAIAGVMLVDYYLVRRGMLDVAALFRHDGRYARVNPRAMVSLFLGIAPSLPGFAAHATGNAASLSPFWAGIYTHAWFVSLLLAGVCHGMSMKLAPQRV